MGKGNISKPDDKDQAGDIRKEPKNKKKTKCPRKKPFFRHLS